MQDLLPVVFTVSIIVLTIILSVVGIYLLIILHQIKQTLENVNKMVDNVEDRVSAVINPIKNIGGISVGIKTGLKVADSFISWINRSKDHQDEE